MTYNIDNLSSIPIELLESILDVVNFILVGKGQERHGNNEPIMEQDWNIISRKTGPEFLTGQAAKKIFEIRNLKDEQKQIDEIKGAISYLFFWLMWQNNISKKLEIEMNNLDKELDNILEDEL